MCPSMLDVGPVISFNSCILYLPSLAVLSLQTACNAEVLRKYTSPVEKEISINVLGEIQ